MPILVKPTVVCNVSCDYCYQRNLRLTTKQGYDMDLIEKTLREQYSKTGQEIVFHGGEITTLPIDDFRRAMKLSYELTGKSAIQTNGYQITDEHIEIFKEYKTSVGISIDGPWPLNSQRYGGSIQERKKKTERVMRLIERMVDIGIHPGIICVINREHVKVKNRELFKQWLKWLQALGVNGGRMNPVQFDKEILGNPAILQSFVDFYLDMANTILSDQKLKWQPVRDVVDNLLGLGTGTCVFTKCDPYSTNAAVVITGTGELTSCLHTAINTRPFIRAEKESLERYEILRQTPQEYGGCMECRYWKVCYGHCPASGLQGDWRNRGVYCPVIKALYEFTESRIKGLFPNIILVTETPEEDYELRSSARMGNHTFKFMLPSDNFRPSSWTACARDESQCRPPSNKYLKDMGNGFFHMDHDDAALLNREGDLLKSANFQRVQSGTKYSDQFGYLKDMGGGWKHADHSDC